MSIYLAAIMIVAAVALFVAAPLVEGARSRRRAAPPGDAERHEHQRALAVQGLRELEFDHEMGKLDEADYATLKRTLENRALAAMAALDRLAAPPSPENAATPVMPGLDRGIPRASVPAAALAGLCPVCGAALAADGNFCPACGAPLDAPAAAARAR